jgi:hypothetical protein
VVEVGEVEEDGGEADGGDGEALGFVLEDLVEEEGDEVTGGALGLVVEAEAAGDGVAVGGPRGGEGDADEVLDAGALAPAEAVFGGVVEVAGAGVEVGGGSHEGEVGDEPVGGFLVLALDAPGGDVLAEVFAAVGGSGAVGGIEEDVAGDDFPPLWLPPR